MVFLITDDSRHARNLIKSYLAELDIGPYDTLETEDVEGTLKMMQTKHIDCVLLDWNLSSKMTGLDVLKEIRKMDKHKDTSVIMVSSESDKFNVVEALKCGANDFVVKPIDKNSFAEKVIKNISR